MTKAKTMAGRKPGAGRAPASQVVLPASPPVTPVGLRRQQKEDTRQAILDAAIACFAHLGFDGTNFREITTVCGMDRPLILYHFQSKQNLWQQAVEEIERRFNRAFDAIYEPPASESDREIVRYTLDCYINALVAVPQYAQVLLREGSGQGERMEWLAHHFAPRAAINLPVKDKLILQRLRQTVLRDILASSLVAFVALGPLLERSLAVASKQKTVGVYPLTKKARSEFIDYMLVMIFGS